MRVLVFGAAGLLGSNVVETGSIRDHDVVGTVRSTDPAFDRPLYRVDLRERNEVRGVLEETLPDVVVNCAAMTDVDECERSPDVARTVNASAPGWMAETCADLGARLVHVSTDYVYRGDARSPYSEDDQTAPIQAYGKTKLAGDRAVMDSSVDGIVVRPSFVYGVHRASEELTGFPAWVSGRIRRGERTELFDDQRVTPSRAGQVATTVYELLESRAVGTYHVASRSCVTPHRFGRMVGELTGEPTDVLERGSTDDDRPAARPAYTCLDVDRVERELDRPQPTLRDDLAAIASYVEP